MRFVKGFPIPPFRKMLKHARELSPHVIHLHDALMAPCAILLSFFLRRPLIFDDHEIWPYLVLASERHWILRAIGFLGYFILEMLTAKLATIMITVTDEMKSEFVRMYGLNGTKIAVVPNAPSLKELEDILPTKDPKLANRIVITYVGGIEKLRGLDTVLEACATLETSEEFVLVIVGGNFGGTGDLEIRRLREYARLLGIENRVYFTGWLPFRRAMAYVAASDICLVPHKVNRLTALGMPHKISQYLFFGKATICSPLPSIHRIFEGAVLTMAPSPHSIALAIGKLISDEKLRHELGKKGREIVVDKYNWERQALNLLSVYKDVVFHEKLLP